jgi:hypothetical protein
MQKVSRLAPVLLEKPLPFAFPERFAMAWLSQRLCQPELMEQPDLDPTGHRLALRGLSRVNWFSHSAGILWPPLRDLARELHPRPVRVLDLATGAGDLPVRLWRHARREGLNLELAGCDVSAVAIDHARTSANRAGAPVDFFVHDVMQGPLLTGPDVVMASLFLHHQPGDAGAVALLRRMAQTADKLVLVNDLVRHPVHLVLAHVATRLLTTSPVVHYDGPCSVAAGFTLPEVRRLAEQAGLHKATIARRWPFRFLLTWRRSS